MYQRNENTPDSRKFTRFLLRRKYSQYYQHFFQYPHPVLTVSSIHAVLYLKSVQLVKNLHQTTANALAIVNRSKQVINNFQRFHDLLLSRQKTLKSNTGGVSFCWIGMQYAKSCSPKCTPPHLFFCNFAGWVMSINIHETVGIFRCNLTL